MRYSCIIPTLGNTYSFSLLLSFVFLLLLAVLRSIAIETRRLRSIRIQSILCASLSLAITTFRLSLMARAWENDCTITLVSAF